MSLESIGVIKKGKTEIAAAYIGRADRLPVCYDICIIHDGKSRGAATAPRVQAGCKQTNYGVQKTVKRGASPAPNPSTEPSIEPPHRPEQSLTSEETTNNKSNDGIPDLTLLPEALRHDVGQLVDGLAHAQSYIDLLVARLEHDQCLPIEKKLRAPIFWLRSVIGDMNPDFYAAEKVARKRETQAAAARRIQEKNAQQGASEERKARDIQTAQQLLDSLSEEELSQVAERAALELPAVIGSGKRQEIRLLVMSRMVGTDLARVAVLKALRDHVSHPNPV